MVAAVSATITAAFGGECELHTTGGSACRNDQDILRVANDALEVVRPFWTVSGVNSKTKSSFAWAGGVGRRIARIFGRSRRLEFTESNLRLHFYQEVPGRSPTFQPHEKSILLLHVFPTEFILLGRADEKGDSSDVGGTEVL